jgi:putative transposase
VELAELKATVEQVCEKYAFSERRACRVMRIAVTTYRYRSQGSDEPLRTKLVELAREKPRFGDRRLHVLLGRSGERVNHKRLHRIYREAGLMIRRKKRKHCVREGKPLLARTAANQEWALDFVHDASCRVVVFSGERKLGAGQ